LPRSLRSLAMTLVFQSRLVRRGERRLVIATPQNAGEAISRENLQLLNIQKRFNG